MNDDFDEFTTSVAAFKAAIWDDLLVPQLERIVVALNKHLVYIGTLIKGVGK